MNNAHHTIPISIEWENIQENIMVLPDREHRELHNTQNIPYRILRNYRERVNGLLLPTNYLLLAKEELWNRYFEKATIKVPEQKQSIFNQTKRYWMINNEEIEENVSFEWLIWDLIKQQKRYILNCLKKIRDEPWICK